MATPKKELTPEEMKDKFAQITATSIDAQATAFLRSFVSEFSGNFEEVLDLAEEFKKYAPEGGEVRELEEDKAHLFLERRGETLTVKELRDALREIDLDNNKRVSFIEYCLYKYKKTMAQLFEDKPGDLKSLLEALEAAILAYQTTLAKKAEREKKMKELEEQSQGSGVKAMKAKAELEAMRNEDQLARNKEEISAGAKQRAAKKALDEGDPYAEEQKRLAAEKKKKDEEEALKRQASRNKLAAMAAKFQ